MDLAELHEKIELEIENYQYPYSGKEVGHPKSSAWIADQLNQLRAALVTPYWISIDCGSYAIVADDRKRYLLAYNARVQEYLLLEKFGDRLIDIEVHGDAVGCFMAR